VGRHDGSMISIERGVMIDFKACHRIRNNLKVLRFNVPLRAAIEIRCFDCAQSAIRGSG